MPLLPDQYKAKFHNKIAILNAIGSAYYRKTEEPDFEVIKFNTPDNDEFVSHWKFNNKSKLIIFLPGLMGNYNSSYIRGFVPKAINKGYDVCVLNARSTTEPNKKSASFHAAFYHDLKYLLDQDEIINRYHEVNIVGFSMGGSITLNFVGREYEQLSDLVKNVACVSTPLVIAPGAVLLAKSKNIPYMAYMYRKIRTAVYQKEEMLRKDGFDVDAILKAKTFHEIDNLFTAKAFGFEDHIDYYEKAAALSHLPNITVPTLLINALDDPMLSDESYPFELSKNHPNLFFEATKHGGHMGYADKNGLYFEDRILDFFNK